MAIELSESLKKKYNELQNAIQSKEKLIIAYSGGVDSALLAKVAYNVLGKNAWAVLVNSETVPKFELDLARDLATKIGISFEILEATQLSDKNFTKNDTNRCYLCRKKMAEFLRTFANEKGDATIAAGAQATDLDDFRPGIKAFHEAGIWHPFIDLNISKQDIRQLAEHLNLPVFDKPSMACLSSRVPYGQEITHEILEMISLAEDYLRNLGFTVYRARVHNNILRIEINQNEFNILMKHRSEIIRKMKQLGFSYITLDLEGFRSGSMNEVLGDGD